MNIHSHIYSCSTSQTQVWLHKTTLVPKWYDWPHVAMQVAWLYAVILIYIQDYNKIINFLFFSDLVNPWNKIYLAGAYFTDISMPILCTCKIKFVHVLRTKIKWSINTVLSIFWMMTVLLEYIAQYEAVSFPHLCKHGCTYIQPNASCWCF